MAAAKVDLRDILEGEDMEPVSGDGDEEAWGVFSWTSWGAIVARHELSWPETLGTYAVISIARVALDKGTSKEGVKKVT